MRPSHLARACPQAPDYALRRACRALAWLYVEVRRGYRPVTHLRPYMTAQAYLRASSTRLLPSQRPVVADSDVRDVHLTRHANGLVIASVTARLAWPALGRSMPGPHVHQ